MTKFDQFIRESVSRKDIPMPQDFQARVDRTLAELPEVLPLPARRRMPRFLTGAACFFLAFFLLLPNVSPAYAKAASQIPLVGALVEVFTLRDYDYQDKTHELQAQIPAVSVPGGGAGQEQINAEAVELVDKIVQDFCESLEDGPSAVNVTYETVTNTETWFTLKLTVEEVQASGAIRYVYRHIDRTTGEAVTLGDLFDREGRRALAAQVLEQMDGGDYFPEELPEVLEENQNFYFDQENLVLVFDEYTIAPGSMGTPSFSIAPEQYRSLMAR